MYNSGTKFLELRTVDGGNNCDYFVTFHDDNLKKEEND